jgi:Leucine-rich repeat (LRR) protein
MTKSNNNVNLWYGRPAEVARKTDPAMGKPHPDEHIMPRSEIPTLIIEFDRTAELQRLGEYTRLEVLVIRYNDELKDRDMPADLPPTLRQFWCMYNPKLKHLPRFSDGLEVLIVEGNPKLRKLPPFPPRIRNLYCNNNALECVPPLPPSVQHLHCNGNKLRELPALHDGLLELSCTHNDLAEIHPMPSTLRAIWCTDNPRLRRPDYLPHMWQTRH